MTIGQFAPKMMLIQANDLNKKIYLPVVIVYLTNTTKSLTNVKTLQFFWLLIPAAFAILLISGCGGNFNFTNKSTEPVSHEIFDEILKKNVSDKGMVNYKAIQQDSARLNEYLTLLSCNPPSKKNWTENERLAYWINAYNAYTIQLIIRNYPLKSIKDIGANIKIPFVNTPWDIKFIQIGEEKMDLNNIEHGVIRDRFNEPRIHFAVVCASYSCPYLRNEAFTGEKLDAQLDDQARRFINDGVRNKITKESVELSKIFKWYKGDFTKKQSLIEYINQYSDVKIEKGTSIDHLEYNWSLNEQ